MTAPARSWRPRAGFRRRLGTLALLGAGALGLIWSGLPICPTAALFGVPCPGCGLTRASLALLHGDVHRAAALHPLVFVLLPAVVGAVLWGSIGYLRGTPGPAPSPARGRLLSAAAGVLLAALLGVWLLRFAGYFGGPAPVERPLLGFRR